MTGGTTAGAWRSIEVGLALMPVVVPPTAGADAATDSTYPDAAASDVPSSPPTPRYPVVAEAALAGDLSVEAAGLITVGLETLTDRISAAQLHALEGRLVLKAVHLAVHEVRRLVTTAVAKADLPGLEERERRQHAERFVVFKEDHTGMVTFTGKLDAVTAAPIRTVIEQVVTQDFRARRHQDPMSPDRRTADVRTVGQMRADALFQICRHALGCKNTDQSGVRTTIVVRMTKNAFDCGQGVGRIDGTDQPVSVGQLRRLAGDAGVIPAVLGGDSEVLDLGRRKRMFTRAQRLALLERDGGCAKCHAPPEHCEAHHIDWWDNGGTTDLANGVMLCTRCHHDIHRHGWNIRVQAGRVEFIPPPTINPTRQPQPGGLAALEVLPDQADDVGDTGDAGSHDDHDPPGNPGENSAHNATDRDNPARQRARHPKRHAA
ncbi:MAG: DUF222 domain-containing protein [Demequina sp.]|nr:DUF222 domain-containing protein [Demequina sp.]